MAFLLPLLGFKALMELSYNKIQVDKIVTAGSATACILTIDLHTGDVRVANLGDSGYLLIRDNDVLAR